MELGGVGVLAFGLAERWPRRLPSGLARWVVQVLAVGTVMAPANLVLTLLDQAPGAPSLWSSGEKLGEFGASTAIALLIAPWTALAALIRQKDALVRHQALAFDLERSEVECEALEARLHLLQARVAPHFLFNTLANVQALVDVGSPRASAVLASLTAYLRAAMPRLHGPVPTMAAELQLVEAYLELMHMRIPDRLRFRLEVDAAARGLRCPPMTLLTLVENAVRHGIDPNEDGGEITVEVRRRDDRCLVRVTDTGLGLSQGAGLDTPPSSPRHHPLPAIAPSRHLRDRYSGWGTAPNARPSPPELTVGQWTCLPACDDASAHNSFLDDLLGRLLCIGIEHPESPNIVLSNLRLAAGHYARTPKISSIISLQPIFVIFALEDRGELHIRSFGTVADS